MAVVYRARHRELETERAVKILPPERAKDNEFLSRFLREAKMAANVEHKNVVRVYNVGEDRGFHFIEMEFVHGTTLTHLLKKYGQLPAPVALAIIAEVAEGLLAAHTSKFQHRGQIVEGIIHRDLKPDNIKVSPDGDCKLMDLGIARPVDVSETVAGVIQGTFAYMSPEQWEGLPDIDIRTDLFSLGVVLYESCAGERPFKGNSLQTIMKAATQGKYEPLHDVTPMIDPSIDHIIQKALAPDRDKRYKNTALMLEDLRRSLAEFGVVDTRQLIKAYLSEGDEALNRLHRVHSSPNRAISSKFSKSALVAMVISVLLVISLGYLWLGTNSEPKVATVTISANYGPIEVFWDGERVTKPVSPGDPKNFIAEKVTWGQHVVRVVLTQTKQEKEITVNIEEPNQVVRVSF